MTHHNREHLSFNKCLVDALSVCSVHEYQLSLPVYLVKFKFKSFKLRKGNEEKYILIPFYLKHCVPSCKLLSTFCLCNKVSLISYVSNELVS